MFKVLVGGPNPAPEVVKPDLGKDREPISWYPQGQEFYESILLDFQLKGIVDMCAVDLALPLTCICLQLPYVGITPTAEAVMLCRNKLLRMVWESMQNADSALFETGLVEILQNGVAADGNDEEDPVVEPAVKKQRVKKEPKAKPNPKEKANAKPTKKKDAIADDAVAAADPAVQSFMERLAATGET